MCEWPLVQPPGPSTCGLGPWRLDLGPLTHIRSITVKYFTHPSSSSSETPSMKKMFSWKAGHDARVVWGLSWREYSGQRRGNEHTWIWRTNWLGCVSMTTFISFNLQHKQTVRTKNKNGQITKRLIDSFVSPYNPIVSIYISNRQNT